MLYFEQELFQWTIQGLNDVVEQELGITLISTLYSKTYVWLNWDARNIKTMYSTKFKYIEL